MTKSENSEEREIFRPWQSYHTVFTNAKAGMEGVDKEKVQRIVYEMSKGSKFFKNEERKEAYIKQKIDNMQAQRANLTDADLSHYQTVADRRILELEATRDLTRAWLHVDMDAFYAAVETLSNPSLKGKPMAVGGMSMISTANYEARKYGVRAAMPGFIARKLCPQLIFVPVDFKKYTHFSALTRKVFERYDPNFMAASLDEAYLDITNVCRERGITGEDVAEELRKGVYEETGLTCSAGVGPNQLLAKICSDINKPNGQFVLPNDRMAVMTFISSLPIRKIGGIGKVTEHLLRDVLEVKTCEEMLQKGALLCALFSPSSRDFFLSVGLGLGRTDTPEVRLRKSISNERTFSAANDEALFYGKLVDLAEMLSADMEKEGLCGRSLTLKLKTASFDIRSRAVTLPNYICSAEDILKHASKLLKAELPISLRLIGLRMSQFNEDKDGAMLDPTQRTLSNYIISKHSSTRNVDEHSSFASDLNDNHLVHEPPTGLVDNTSYDNCKDHLNNDASMDTNPSVCNDSHSIGEIGKNDGSIRSPKAEVNVLQTMRYPHNIYEAEASQSANRDSFPLPSEEITLNLMKKRACHSSDEAASSSDHDNQYLWVDDYKCVVCGVELPPSFVQERQEHSDYHLAERLQKEMSGTPLNDIGKQRLNPKDQASSQNKRKKKIKSSPEAGKYTPIDRFFAKSNQNFQ